MILRLGLILLLLALFTLAGCAGLFSSRASLERMKTQTAKLAPVELSCDLSHLSPGDREAIGYLIKAAKLMDEAFLRQVYSGNEALLAGFDEGGDDAIYQDYFKAMFGPWDRLDEDRPFLGSREKPAGANFYPEDMTKAEFENWLTVHPGDRKALEGTFTMVRREAGNLKAVPYSVFFKDQLEPAAALLRMAARATTDETLRTYLQSRAQAFLTNDYYQSDMDWMDLAGDIEVVIGPYEVYEDGLFGYKAAFEAFVCVVDPEESQKLNEVASYLDDMEQNLPNPKEDKNFERGSSSPIKVANEVFAAGDTKAGIQTLAFNLPNDERVREAKGSKKVMLKNMMNAKYEKILVPIAEQVLRAEDLGDLAFDAYFNQVLMHEVSHGLGPGRIVLDGEETTVNRELADLYSTIEECKADTLGVYNTQFLIDKGLFPKALEQTLYTTYLAGMFRSIRFGINEAHGGGVAIQLNYCLEKGGVAVDGEGRFYVDPDGIRKAVRGLAAELLAVEAHGDYEGAKKLIDTYCFEGPETVNALERLKAIPVDVRPLYPLAD